MDFYHVVTERPMQVGQHILFDEEHHSGVYFRVMENKNTIQNIIKAQTSLVCFLILLVKI